MSNNLGKVRKEFNLTQSDLAKILDTSSTNIGYYEQEKRDFSTKLLIKLSDMFKVSIDYLLGIKDYGIYVYYEGKDIIEFIISEDKLKEYIKKKVIYYKEDSYKRYINLNELLGAKGSIDLSYLLSDIESLDEFESLFDELPVKSNKGLEKILAIQKLKTLDPDKLHAIKTLLDII